MRIRSRCSWLVFITLITTACASSMVHAQYSETKPAVDKDKVQKRLAEYKARLNLTDEQVAAMKPLMREEAQKLKAIKDKYADDTSRRAKKKMLKEAKTVQDHFTGQLKGILSEDQMKIWGEIKKERQAEVKAEYEKRKAEGSQ